VTRDRSHCSSNACPYLTAASVFKPIQHLFTVADDIGSCASSFRASESLSLNRGITSNYRPSSSLHQIQTLTAEDKFSIQSLFCYQYQAVWLELIKKGRNITVLIKKIFLRNIDSQESRSMLP